MTNYLDGVKSRSGICDYEVQVPTWETLYPFMPERLLAIEADELYGDNFQTVLPSGLEKYPYKRVEKFHHLVKMGFDWYETFISDNPDYDYDCDYGELVKTTIHVSYNLLTPYNHMDIMFKLVKPSHSKR